MAYSARRGLLPGLRNDVFISYSFRARVARLAMDIEVQLREMKTKLPGVYLAPCALEKEMKLRDLAATRFGFAAWTALMSSDGVRRGFTHEARRHQRNIALDGEFGASDRG